MVSNFGCKYTYFSANGKTKRRKVRGARSLTNFKWRATHQESRGRFYSLLKFLYYTSFLTPCALPSVQLFSNAKAKIRTYSRTSKFST